MKFAIFAIVASLVSCNAASNSWDVKYTCDDWCKTVDACGSPTDGVVAEKDVEACLAAAGDKVLNEVHTADPIAAITGLVVDMTDATVPTLDHEPAFSLTLALKPTVDDACTTVYTLDGTDYESLEDINALEFTDVSKLKVTVSAKTTADNTSCAVEATLPTADTKAVLTFALTPGSTPTPSSDFTAGNVLCLDTWCQADECGYGSNSVVQADVDTCFGASSSDEDVLSQQMSVTFASDSSIKDNASESVTINFADAWNVANSHADTVVFTAGTVIPLVSGGNCDSVTYTGVTVLNDENGFIDGSTVTKDAPTITITGVQAGGTAACTVQVDATKTFDFSVILKSATNNGPDSATSITVATSLVFGALALAMMD